MRGLFLLIAGIASLTVTELGLGQAAPATPKPQKLTAQDIRVQPFAQEQSEVKFKSNSREFPDELTVTKGEKIHIYGKKRTGNVVGVRGGGAANFGKLALLPPGERKGTLFLKTSFGGTFYFAALEVPDDGLKSAELKLKEGRNYTWNTKLENGRMVLRVLGADGEQIGSTSAIAEKVLGVGFAATVRNPGNAVDLFVTYE